MTKQKNTEDNKDIFLSKIGNRIHLVSEVKPGDVLGIASQMNHYVSINYVHKIHSEPSYTKLDYFPYVGLKGPYLGLTISENVEPSGFTFFSIESQHVFGRKWYPPNTNEIVGEYFDQSDDLLKESLLANLSMNERAYLIHDDYYKKLGNLIPLIELPSVSFLPQSRDLNELVKMIDDSKEDIESIRTATQNLKRIFHCR